jgi:hypothetical protein
MNECKVCKWRKINEGCKVFVDREEVINDKSGVCNALIVRPGKLQKLKKEIAAYSGQVVS